MEIHIFIKISLYVIWKTCVTEEITEYVSVKRKNTVVHLFQYLAQKTALILLASVIGWGQRQTCERGNEPSGSTKCGEILD